MVWVRPVSSERESRRRCFLLKLSFYATIRAETPRSSRVVVGNAETFSRHRRPRYLKPERQPPPPSFRRLPLLFSAPAIVSPWRACFRVSAGKLWVI